MKKIKFVLILLMLPCMILGGCNNKTLDYQTLKRDNYNTGGKLTFVYDEGSHTATFGGEGETIQYYTDDVAKGWSEEGCRVGVQLLIPPGVKDYKSATATMNKEKLTAEDFFVNTNDNSYHFALFQPIVTQEENTVELKISWQEGYEEQTYLIVIKQGTSFMPKPE